MFKHPQLALIALLIALLALPQGMSQPAPELAAPKTTDQIAIKLCMNYLWFGEYDKARHVAGQVENKEALAGVLLQMVEATVQMHVSGDFSAVGLTREELRSMAVATLDIIAEITLAPSTEVSRTYWPYIPPATTEELVIKSYRIRNTCAIELAGHLHELGVAHTLSSARFTADHHTNSLVVVATPFDHDAIASLVAELDITELENNALRQESAN